MYNHEVKGVKIQAVKLQLNMLIFKELRLS